MKYRKKPVVIEATQWFKNGDHPFDESEIVDSQEPGSEPFLTEGKVVRRYRHPYVDGNDICMYCRTRMKDHGWVDTLESGHIVCPGDWIITGVKGEHYPCKPDVFEQTYEKIEEGTQ